MIWNVVNHFLSFFHILLQSYFRNVPSVLTLKKHIHLPLLPNLHLEPPYMSLPNTASPDLSAPFDGSTPDPDSFPRRSDQVKFTSVHLDNYHCFSTILSQYEFLFYCEASANPIWQKAIADKLQVIDQNHT